MSIFPQSVLAEPISQIKVSSNQQRLVAEINQLRFRPHIVYKQIIDILNAHVNTINITFKELNNRKIVCQGPTQIYEASVYFGALLNMNDILSDLYFNEQNNIQFAKIFPEQDTTIRDSTVEATFRSKYMISAIQYYEVKTADIQLQRHTQLLHFMILDQYFRLKRKAKSASNTTNSHPASIIAEESVENSILNCAADQIGLMSNNFNLCFFKSTSHTMVLALAHTNNFLSISHIGKSVQALSQNNRNNTQKKSIKFLPAVKKAHSWAKTSNSRIGENFKFTTTFESLSHTRHTQSIDYTHCFVPLAVVEKLFHVLDKDMDNYVQLEDIKREFVKNNFDFNDGVYESMYKEATRNRSVIFKQQLSKGMTLKELQNTLQSRRQIVKSTPNLVDKPYKRYWFMLLYKMGYDKLHPKEMLGNDTLSQLRQSNTPSNFKMRKLKISVQQPEGNHFIANTKLIKRVDRYEPQKPQEYRPKEEETLVNNMLTITQEGVTTIGFSAQAKYAQVSTRFR